MDGSGHQTLQGSGVFKPLMCPRGCEHRLRFDSGAVSHRRLVSANLDLGPCKARGGLPVECNFFQGYYSECDVPLSLSQFSRSTWNARTRTVQTLSELIECSLLAANPNSVAGLCCQCWCLALERLATKKRTLANVGRVVGRGGCGLKWYLE